MLIVVEYTRRLTSAGRRDRGGSARGGAGADGGVAAAGTVAGILLYCFQNQFLEAGEGMTCLWKRHLQGSAPARPCFNSSS